MVLSQKMKIGIEFRGAMIDNIKHSQEGKKGHKENGPINERIRKMSQEMEILYSVGILNMPLDRGGGG